MQIPKMWISATLYLLMAFGCVSNSNSVKEKQVVKISKLDLSQEIATKGNSWVVNDPKENQTMISDNGIQNWDNPDTRIRTYFKTDTAGNLHVGLNIKGTGRNSKIAVKVGQTTKEIQIADSDSGKIEVGIFKISEIGYQYIEIQGLERTLDYFPDIDKIWIGGPATKGELTYVKNDFYWGRRGPSVHLNYETPKDKNVLWFYNEITVPEGDDVIGSYFMANGFGEGYFGMQVNSETERRVLFSVWSPYETQDPNEIPEDYKIILMGKGTGVATGEFGNEGSGGQSYAVLDWKTGNTYRFLLKGEPAENNSTDYTAYFYMPEKNKWQLIASFRRPYTHTYLTRLHSFLENFMTETGYITRKAAYTNQWVKDADGDWHELTKAKFTADATARKGARLDYAGGAKENAFFMKNCGFFSKNTPIDSYHERKTNGTPPKIDFSELEIPQSKN